MKLTHAQHAHVMAHQTAASQTGTVYFEEGLEIKTVRGEVWPAETSVSVFPDSTSPAFTQPRTAIPNHRIVKIEMDGEDLELVEQ